MNFIELDNLNEQEILKLFDDTVELSYVCWKIQCDNGTSGYFVSGSYDSRGSGDYNHQPVATHYGQYVVMYVCGTSYGGYYYSGYTTRLNRGCTSTFARNCCYI